MKIFMSSHNIQSVQIFRLKDESYWPVTAASNLKRFMGTFSVQMVVREGFCCTTVNQQILAAIKFGVSQNKMIYVNLAAIKFGVSPRPARLCSVRSTYMLAATNISENTQFAKYNSTPKFVDLQYMYNLYIYNTVESPPHHHLHAKSAHETVHHQGRYKLVNHWKIIMCQMVPLNTVHLNATHIYVT